MLYTLRYRVKHQRIYLSMLLKHNTVNIVTGYILKLKKCSTKKLIYLDQLYNNVKWFKPKRKKKKKCRVLTHWVSLIYTLCRQCFNKTAMDLRFFLYSISTNNFKTFFWIAFKFNNLGFPFPFFVEIIWNLAFLYI